MQRHGTLAPNLHITYGRNSSFDMPQLLNNMSILQNVANLSKAEAEELKTLYPCFSTLAQWLSVSVVVVVVGAACSSTTITTTASLTTTTIGDRNPNRVAPPDGAPRRFALGPTAGDHDVDRKTRTLNAQPSTPNAQVKCTGPWPN